ncbi:MAG: hypothetical protein ACRCUI_09280 [Polymorphobacter sp.]
MSGSFRHGRANGHVSCRSRACQAVSGQRMNAGMARNLHRTGLAPFVRPDTRTISGTDLSPQNPIASENAEMCKVSLHILNTNFVVLQIFFQNFNTLIFHEFSA